MYWESKFVWLWRRKGSSWIWIQDGLRSNNQILQTKSKTKDRALYNDKRINTRREYHTLKIYVPNIGAGSSKRQESFRKTFISALSSMPKPLTGWITINCGKF